MNGANPKLPLGISDFEFLREEEGKYLYIDKTRQLFDMLDVGKYLFLARPRRFGKSLLCSSIAHLYAGRRKLFSRLAIEPLWDWSKTNPVLHFSMARIGSFTIETLEANLLQLLSQAAIENGVSIELRDISLSFGMLLEALHKKTGRRVVVIIDEYEKPVHDHIDNLPLAKQMRNVLSSFYGALKGFDQDLEKLFITGVGRMVKASIFSQLNQMKDLTLHKVTAEICGYTGEELKSCFIPNIHHLMQERQMSESQVWDKLQERYNGYWWGKGSKVYNPWAILNCLDDAEFGNYWWASGTSKMLVDLAENIDRPGGDLEGIKTTELALHFDLNDLRPEPLLWQTGYLTIQEVRGQTYTLGFPNGEVREAWFSMMLNRFRDPRKEVEGFTTAAVMLQALIEGDHPQFEEALRALFAALPGELQIAREAYYHSVFIAALQAAGGRLRAESRTDKGRADAVLETPERVYIIEFKLGRAAEALAQIKEKRYYEAYLTDRRKLVLLGTGGFLEKEIECLWEEVPHISNSTV